MLKNYKLLKLLLIYIVVFSFSCGGGDSSVDASLNNAPSEFFHYPSLFYAIDSESITGIFTVYNFSGDVLHQSTLSIENGFVNSETVSLSAGESYYFVFAFYYTLDDGSSIPIANVVLTEQVSGDNYNISYNEDVILYDNPDGVNNDLSASFSVGVYDLNNLDTDGDGISNVREILANTSPNDSSDIPDTIAVNFVDGETVQDTETIFSQYTPSNEALLLYMELPSGYSDENSLADIYQTSWDTTTAEEDAPFTLKFVGQNVDGSADTISVSVIPDNYPNITSYTTTSTIQEGGTATLNWTADNFTDLSISGVGSVNSESGSANVSPITTTVYTLTATRTNAGGDSYTTTADVTVEVNNPPSLASDDTATQGQDPSGGVSLSWTPSDANGDAVTGSVLFYTGSDCLDESPTEYNGSSDAVTVEGLEIRADYSYAITLEDDNGGTTAIDCQNFTSGDEGLVAWWRFDEGTGTTTTDSAGGGHDGTLLVDGEGESGPTWSPGIEGNAIIFDGTDDYVQVSDHVDLQSDAWSLDFWLNRSGAGTNYPRILHKRLLNDAGADLESGWQLVQLSDGSNEVNFAIRSDIETVGLYSQESFDTDTWYHVVATFDGEWARFYINGYLYGSFKMSSDFDASSSDFIIGGGPGEGSFFDGAIDELAYYDRALSTDEVRDSCNRTNPSDVTCADDTIIGQLTPSNGFDKVATRALLSWEEATIPDGKTFTSYILCYSTSIDAIDTEVECASPSTPTTNYSVLEVDPDSGYDAYYWKVATCYNAACTDRSSYSLIWSFSSENDTEVWFKLDETSGSAADNESGTYDGVLHNFDTAHSWDSVGATGDGRSLKFDGTNDYITASPSVMPSGMSSAMAFEAWVYFELTELGSNHTLISNINCTSACADPPTTGGYGIGYDDRGGDRPEQSLNFYGVSTAAGDNFEILAPDNLIDETGWYHIVATYEYDSTSGEGIALLYLDGELVGSEEYDSAVTISGDSLVIGATNYDGVYSGNIDAYMDDIGVYSRALNYQEVLNHYCSVQVLAGEEPEICGL
jgi:hypothetical protein